jgi:hypothetical protein
MHVARALREVLLLVACVNVGCQQPNVDSTTTDQVRRQTLMTYTAPLTTVRRVRDDELCVRAGGLPVTDASSWVSHEPRLRAIASNSAGQHARMVFRYLGPATSRQRGVRQEIGLELLSRDECNLVSTTWRIGTRSVMLATVKTNRDFTRLEECGARGARKLRPFWQMPVERPVIGSTHELAATIRQGLLEVQLDRQPVLRAVIKGQNPPATGSSGVRSDHVKLELLRFEADVLDAARSTPPRCL